VYMCRERLHPKIWVAAFCVVERAGPGELLEVQSSVGQQLLFALLVC
jgi:hypothetical protein